MPRYGYDYYGRDYRDGRLRSRPSRHTARRYPLHGYHTYDLDYGSLGGPDTEYSGRAGYTPGPPQIRDDDLLPRGPYTPFLEEDDRERTLYGGVPPGYRDRRERRRRERVEWEEEPGWRRGGRYYRR